MISIIKPYRESYILYDFNKRKYCKLLQEDCSIIQNTLKNIEDIERAKEIRINSQFTQSKLLKNIVYRFVNLKTPLKVFWDITEACNASCIHCFTNAGEMAKDELTTDQVLCVIDQLVYYGIMSIAFSGGEPFIRTDFMDILQFASNKGMSISVTTNGSLLDSEKIKKLYELKLKSVTISLDGFSQEVFSSIRKGLDVEKVKENIRILSKYAQDKDLEVNVRTTLNSLNVKEIHDILKFCDKLGVDCLKVNNTNMWGRAKNYPSLRISEQEFVNCLLSLQSEAGKFNCRVELPIEKYIENAQETNKLNVCTSTIDTINIFANGDIGPCGFCERQLNFGNVKEDGLYKLFISLLPFNFNNRICKKCSIQRYQSKKKLTSAMPFIS